MAPEAESAGQKKRGQLLQVCLPTREHRLVFSFLSPRQKALIGCCGQTSPSSSGSYWHLIGVVAALFLRLDGSSKELALLGRQGRPV